MIKIYICLVLPSYVKKIQSKTAIKSIIIIRKAEKYPKINFYEAKRIGV
jgi:hypothetical protein